MSNLTTTQMNTGVPDFSVDSESIDEAGPQKENYWYNSEWPNYLGYFDNIPEYNSAIIALARWTVGLGYKTSTAVEALLNNINGWGEDSFQSILQNMIIIKKVNGDSYAEIIRNDKGTLINLKPINPSNIRHVVDKKGIIIRYDELSNKNKVIRPLKPNQVLHLCNNRIANQIHGTSSLKAIKWVIDARNEAMSTWRKLLRRSSMRVIYVDMDDTAKLKTLRDEWKEGIKDHEVLILPGQKGKDFEVVDYDVPPLQPFIDWIRYLEGFFYQALGVPKVIANSADFTEAASKVGFLTFQPVYTEEQTLLEQDLWSQLAIRIKFNRPPSLAGTLQEDEEKSTGQTGFQPTDTKATMGRVE